MDLQRRLHALARLERAPTPVVSVYLNTHWADEHQRERVRVFLKNAIREARRNRGSPGLDADLEWIQVQGEALVSQALVPEADGVALFACQALGVRELLPVRVPFADAFVVADAPFLRPLAAVLEEAPAALVVFVDGESARVIPVRSDGPSEEVSLESEVPGRHRRGGWAQLAQSRYRRHVEEHRGRHFDAVADVLAHLAEETAFDWIVLAGEPRTLAVFRRHLPAPLAARIAGTIPAGRHEPTSVLLERASATLGEWEGQEERAAVDGLLAEAAQSRRAVAGLEATLEAAIRGAVRQLYLLQGFRRGGAPARRAGCSRTVRQLYLLQGFRRGGRACTACGMLQNGPGVSCRRCGAETGPVELGEALVERVLAAGGRVETVGEHAALAAVGGVAASLRYPF